MYDHHAQRTIKLTYYVHCTTEYWQPDAEKKTTNTICKILTVSKHTEYPIEWKS